MRDLILSLVAILALALINQSVALYGFMLWWFYACYLLSEDDKPKSKRRTRTPKKKYFIIEDTETNTKEKVEI
jgi:hypothetical protein